MIVCFSGTGNSRYCAQMLADKLDDTLLDCFGYIRDQIAADLVSEKPWVFVSPTYAWQLPRIFDRFIRTGCFRGSTDAYFVMTCGSDIGNAAAYIEPLCAEVGLTFRGVMPVVMPENYIAMFEVPDRQEAAEIIAAARPVVQQAAALIRQSVPFPELKVGIKDKSKSGAINQVFYKKYVKADAFAAGDGCIACGRCTEVCVLKNITLEKDKPVWGDQCTHCMACICGCPVNAIEYGKKSKGKPRYQCPPYGESDWK